MFSPGEMEESKMIEGSGSANPAQKTKRGKSPDVGAYISPEVKKKIEESDEQRLAELKEKLGRKSIKEKGGEKKA